MISKNAESATAPWALSLLLWALFSALGMYVILRQLPLSLVDGEFIPVSVDSFYHARRILDAAMGDFSHFYFDPLMHAPEGSWVVWSWGYDLFLSKLVQLGVGLSIAPSPEAAMVFIPTLWFWVNMLLILVIARQLNLSPLMQALALLFPVMSAAIWAYHSVGAVDHHFMELTGVLLNLSLGLAWSKQLGSKWRALLFGGGLGLTLAIHHGLFVLQIPAGLWLFLLWVRGGGTSVRVAWFAGGLVLGVLASCLPSPQFQQGLFSAYFLSWFHLYVAASAALLLMLMYRGDFSAKRLFWILGLAGVLVLLMAGQIRAGVDFVAGQTLLLDRVDETMGLLEKFAAGQGLRMLKSLTLLLFLAPLFTLWLLLARNARPDLLLLGLFAAFGIAMVVMQVRFNYLALPGIVFPALLAAQAWLSQSTKPRHRWFRGSALACMFGLAYLPALDTVAHYEIGGSAHYPTARVLFKQLHDLCEEAPGVVLTDYEYGHFIRYHSTCGSISNSMMLTPLQQEKIRQSERYLGWSPERVQAELPWIRYVLVRKRGDYPSGPLQRALLGAEPFPEGYTFLGQTLINHNGHVSPYARLFGIDHSVVPPHLEDAHQEAGEDGLEAQGGEQ